MKKNLFVGSLLCALCVSTSLQAGYIFKNGRLVNAKDVAEHSIEEHFKMGIDALKQKDWNEAVHQFRVICISFPKADLAKSALYYLGVSYFHYGDFDLSNQNLSLYLTQVDAAEHFEDVYRYKFHIAEAFRTGAKRHLFGSETLPSWASAQEDAIKIYDEIITALPHHELTSKSLFAKAALHCKMQEYKESIAAYQNIIKKFPKTALAQKSFLKIGDVYVKQCKQQPQNPDIIQLAEINLKKCKAAFPKGSISEYLENFIHEMQETYAFDLYDKGCFYERKKLPKASYLYFNTALVQFPQTKIAEQCRNKLKQLKQYANEMDLQVTPSQP